MDSRKYIAYKSAPKKKRVIDSSSSVPPPAKKVAAQEVEIMRKESVQELDNVATEKQSLELAKDDIKEEIKILEDEIDDTEDAESIETKEQEIKNLEELLTSVKSKLDSIQDEVQLIFQQYITKTNKVLSEQ